MPSAPSVPDRGIGRRIAPRTACNVMIEFKDGASQWHRALLADLSATGFRLTGMRPGFDRPNIWLRPAGGEPMPAKVRWCREGSIGCEFLYPLDQHSEAALRDRLVLSDRTRAIA